MYQLFLFLLVTWGSVAHGATGDGDPICFESLDYAKELDVAKMNGAWYIITCSKGKVCSRTYNITVKDSSFTIVDASNNTTVEKKGTYDKGMFKFTPPTASDVEEIAVVLTYKLKYEESAIMYTCSIKNKTKIVTTQYLNRSDKDKLEDPKKFFEGSKDLAGIEWQVPPKATATVEPEKAKPSGASIIVPYAHVISILITLFIRSL